MRLLVAFLLSLVSSTAALAGVATGIYEDPAGAYRIVVTLNDPSGPIGTPWITFCMSGLAGQFTGIVTLGQSFVVTVYTAMSQLAVLSTLNRKGDADLYVYDSLLNLVCSSTLPTAAKIPDQCGFLSSTCNQDATSYAEAFGYKKKNLFHIAVWFSNAV